MFIYIISFTFILVILDYIRFTSTNKHVSALLCVRNVYDLNFYILIYIFILPTHPLMYFSIFNATRCWYLFIYHFYFSFFIYFFLFGQNIRFDFRMSVYSARRGFSERGLDKVSAVHGDPRLPNLGLGHLGSRSRDVLTVRLLKSTTTSTHYIVAR